MFATRRKRDTQRNKVYEAERAAFIYMPLHPNQADALEIRNFIEALGVRANIELRSRGRTSTAWHGSRRIAIAPRHRDVRWVWVHEAAHLSAPAGERHGRLFCAEYLRLTEKAFGRVWRDRLAREFDERGVKWRARKQLAPERLAALREQGKRLAALRHGVTRCTVDETGQGDRQEATL